MFHFTCFNVEDPDDPTVGLVNGEVTIPGNLLRREVFDPVVNQVRVHCRRGTILRPCSLSRPSDLWHGTASPGSGVDRSSNKEGGPPP